MPAPSTVRATFDATVRRYADRDFLHVPTDATHGWAPGAVTLRYEEAASAIAALESGYRAAGYGNGHRVAVALDNRPAFFLHLLALNGLGCSVVPVNAAMSRAELAYVLAHADLAAAVAHAGHLAHVGAALPAGVPLVNADAWPDALPAPSRGPSAAPDEAALLYTSGTTGTPKGCVLGNEYFLQCGALYLSLGGYCAFRPGEDRLVTPLPVTHMNALCVSFMAMVMTGGCLVQLDRFHPSTWWRSVRESRATCFHYLGVMPAMLLSAPPAPEDDLSGRVRFAFGAGVDPRHHATFEHRFGVPLIEAWAMTETGGGAWITANVEPRHVGSRCFGRAPEGLEWRLVAESGGDAAVDEPGELLVRRAGANPRFGFFGGYYKDAAATEAAWDGGWFHTGDVVKVDAEGSFRFVDRLKNVIRRSGENISAVEVESVLQQHPALRACAVTAVPDEIRGEEVFAFAVLAPGAAASAATARSLQEHCLRGLVYFKAPGWVAFVEQLPQTASQKLARGAVKKMAARAVESAAAFDLRGGKKRSAASA